MYWHIGDVYVVDHLRKLLVNTCICGQRSFQMDDFWGPEKELGILDDEKRTNGRKNVCENST